MNQMLNSVPDASFTRAPTRRRKRRSALHLLLLPCAAALLLAIILLGKARLQPIRSAVAAVSHSTQDGLLSALLPRTADEKLDAIRTGDYPEALVTFAENYPETIDFVYRYPDKFGSTEPINLLHEAKSNSVPLLLQWDARWGYAPYSASVIGCTGCGPTALSMVALYLTHDASASPLAIAQYATENGYCVPGSGSSWTLISEGCEAFGMRAHELPLDEGRMRAALDGGSLIILVVGPGDFTVSGHFLVVTGYDENGFSINDPNSRENSEKRWSFDRLSGQIRNLWAMEKA